MYTSFINWHSMMVMMMSVEALKLSKIIIIIIYFFFLANKHEA